MTIRAPKVSMRFGLRTLCAAVAIIAIAVFAANWTYRNSVWRAALLAYERANAAWEADTVAASIVGAASEALMNASIQLPFSDSDAARREHMERIVSIRDRFNNRAPAPDDCLCLSKDSRSIDLFFDRALRGVRSDTASLSR